MLSKSLLVALFNYDILPQDDEYYLRLLDDADFIAVSSQIYNFLKKEKKLDQTPLFFQAQLKENYSQVVYQNIFIKNQTNLIFNQFESQGIDIIPIKGVFFSEKYFGDLGARLTSDIDLLIKPADIEKALEAVKLEGFTVEVEKIPGHFHYSLSKRLPYSPIPLTVELHWDILRKKTANFKIDEFWAQAKPFKEYNHVLELSAYHTFYLICLHGWRHNLNSLKYFIDIIQLLQLYDTEINYSILLKDAKRHQTFKRIVRTLSIVYWEFPFLASLKEFPIENTTRYHTSLSKKKTYQQYLDFIDYQFFSYDSFTHCFIELWSWIIPHKYELNAELNRKFQRHSLFAKYILLYKQRFTSAFNVILKRGI